MADSRAATEDYEVGKQIQADGKSRQHVDWQRELYRRYVLREAAGLGF